MADNFLMIDGSIRTVLDGDDFLELTEGYMGSDARNWLEGKLSDADEARSYAESLEKEMVSQESCFKCRMRKVQELSWELSNIIHPDEIDTEELSKVAEEIRTIAWEGLNR